MNLCLKHHLFSQLAWCIVASGLILLFSCESHDIGQPCEVNPNAEKVADNEGTRIETQESVLQDVTLPCDELLCISSEGRSGYCSKRCRENIGCPQGFSCRAIQEIGDFSKQKFCAWKHCKKATDCGSKDDFCCVYVPSPEVGEQNYLCDFKPKGKKCPKK